MKIIPTTPHQWRKHPIVRWVSVGLVSLTIIVCFVGLDGPFFTLDYAMTLGEDWRRASLPGDLSRVGMSDPTSADLDVSKPKPAIEQRSPDGKWTFVATWVANQGYHWVLKGKANAEYPEMSVQGLWGDCTQISLLWSLDSHYVAITSLDNYKVGDHLRVIDLAGAKPAYCFLKGNSDSVEEGIENASPYGSRPDNIVTLETKQSKAIEWTSDDDLQVTVHELDSLDVQPSEVHTVSREWLHFEGTSALIAKKDQVMRQDFITDL